MNKFTARVAAIIFMAGSFLTVAASAQREVSPRKQFKQLLAQFQDEPLDADLRGQIITLSRKVKPLPAIPDEAIESEGRGKFLFKNAKSTQDYLDAAKEYEKATQAAPWVLGYYSDLCTINEKAEKYAEAKRACEFYLLGLTDQDQIADVKGRIAGLKVGIEKDEVVEAQREAERERNSPVAAQRSFNSMNGKRFFCGELTPRESPVGWGMIRERIYVVIRPNGFEIEDESMGSAGPRAGIWSRGYRGSGIPQDFMGVDVNWRISGKRNINGVTEFYELAKDGDTIIRGAVDSRGGEHIWSTCIPDTTSAVGSYRD
jgi:hypothetical protein